MPNESGALLQTEGEGAPQTDEEAAKPDDKAKAGFAKSKSKTVDQTGFARAGMFIKTLEDPKADTWWKKALACFLKYLMKPLIVVIMFYIWIGKKLYKVYKMLPMNWVYMIIGVMLCFFGGIYFASIAAFEAFRSFGGQALMEELQIIWEEACRANEASEEDDKVDANNDGIADVKQMSANELISHKAKVAMAAVHDPTRLMKAVQFLFSAWLSVIATLKFMFAKTVALSLSICEMLELPITRLFGPLLAMVMGKDLQHWIPAIIGTTIRIIAVAVASFIQSVISAYYSGLRGGKLFAESLISSLGEAGFMDKCPDWIAKKPFDANESYLDEVIGLPLAAAGIIFQLMNGMTCPFPWSIPLFPLQVIEWILRWNIFT
mmetsp:Transcript_86384/g.239551  ORF Transcript_86384/g.239551 Transcript_86384/m.239551 type:complete len:377 (-) Transcript_86384:103-1233(-)